MKAIEKEIGEDVDNEIELVNTKFFDGPNVHALFPVLEARVDLGDWVETPSNKNFRKKLVELLPELNKHSCSEGYEGGFIERLNDGTYPAHIVEHTALSIQNTVGVDVSYGKSRREEGSIYKIVISYEYPELASYALKSAIKIVNKLLSGEKNLESFCEDVLKEAKDAYHREKIGPSTQAILDAAKERDIPYDRADTNYSLFTLGLGKNQEMIWGPETSKTPLIGTEIVQEKDITKDFLYERGFSVPRGEVVTSEKEAIKVADDIGYPVVIKPVKGNHGEGVFVDVKNPDELSEAFSLAKEYDSYLLVERYLVGNDYRALIVNNEVVALSKKIPAHVKGDGSSTVKELVKLTNQDPKRGDDHENILTKIKLNEEALLNLEHQGLTPDYIPGEDEIVWLTKTSNISTGGTAEDKTPELHPSLKSKLERASRMLDMDLMGIDFIADRIDKPVEEINWGIIEANASPGLRMHLYPSAGEAQPVGEKIIDHLYPKGKGRIPTVAITGTNGKTTTSRLVEWLARNQGHHTGLAVTGGIWSNGIKVEEGDTTGPWSANLVLKDPEVDYAVLETARGGILKRGLGYDKASVGVLLNIREDHIGLNGVEDRDDIFWVKSLVVEATDEDGNCIINGNDDYTEKILERANGEPILFGVEKNEIIRKHISDGGEAFVYEEDELVAYLEDGKKSIANVKELPYLRDGVKMLVENTLAAMAAGYASGLKIDRFKTALKKFDTSEDTTPGRLNVFEVNERNVVLDYAHNPDGLNNLGDFAEKISNNDQKILVFTALGDRSDQSIVENGEVAAKNFDKIVFTEKEDLRRGREEGEIASLLEKGAVTEDKNPITITKPMKALSYALVESEPGDAVICANLDFDSDHLKKIMAPLSNNWNMSKEREEIESLDLYSQRWLEDVNMDAKGN